MNFFNNLNKLKGDASARIFFRNKKKITHQSSSMLIKIKSLIY